MCKGLSALPATCLKSAKDMKHRIGFLLHKADLHSDQGAGNSKERDSAPRSVPAEVGKWKESLNNLVNDSVGLPAFATFLKTEFSEENIEFWMACEDYKKIASQESLAAKANDIYDKYVAVNSPREVNLDSATREETRKNLQNAAPSCFEEAQRKIFLLMEKDSYRRFLNSKLFLDMAQSARNGFPCGVEKRRRGTACNLGQILPQLV
ncbi:regulator of G-protein signaling 4-like [Brienomyrus brachyistius]|uniref:regulator of G-protein signaling 4-like n=1 Tax=Brienomyrus brachyistius TaxID=42636 RepID=UPI0020B2A567|nr:regulator of G-protein signaling 4-like [Brienomyrus brachyistius]